MQAATAPAVTPAQRPARGALLLLAALAAAALAVIAPMFFLGNASGHDFNFHLASWMDVARQWRAGVLYPRWAVWANYGYGEPRFIFYPPASWLLGAALGTLLPWKAVPGAFAWIALVLAGVCMFRLAREWLPPKDAIGAALLYAVNPYHLVLVYLRSDFAELLASALLPLAVHYAVECGRVLPDAAAAPAGRRVNPRPWRGVPGLALVFAAIWLANAPAAVIASYSLALVLVVLAAVRRSLRTLFAGTLGLALGLLLAGFYIFPAAYEQSWVNIAQVFSTGLRPEQNFIFTSINDPEHNLVNLLVSTIAAAQIAITAMAAMASREPRSRARDLWWALVVLAAAASALMLPAAQLAWRILPKLRFVQFPWRWLIALALPFAFFVAATVRGARLRWLWMALLPLALVGGGVYVGYQSWWDTEDVPALQAALDAGKGYEGTDEYNARGRDHDDLPAAAPLIKAEAGEESETAARVRIERWAPEEKIFFVTAPEPVTAAVRLLDYPAWRVQVNGRNAAAESEPHTGQMRIALPAGESRVRVWFGRTADRTLGVGISLLAAAMLAYLTRPRRRTLAWP